jgi:hypothetical protein
LVDRAGNPNPILFGQTAAEAWQAGERDLKRGRADLERTGWRAVLAVFPDAG